MAEPEKTPAPKAPEPRPGESPAERTQREQQQRGGQPPTKPGESSK